MASTATPPVLREPGNAAGCLLGCGAVIFLTLFVPFAVAGAWSGDIWGGVAIAFPVASIATLGGVTAMGVFALIDWSRKRPEKQKRRRAIQELRKRIIDRELVSDEAFCAAIPDCDPDMLCRYRNLLGEYLGVPPAHLNPEECLQLPDDEECVNGLWHCLQRVADRPLEQFLYVEEPLSLDDLDGSEECRVKDEAKTFCHIVDTQLQKRSPQL